MPAQKIKKSRLQSRVWKSIGRTQRLHAIRVNGQEEEKPGILERLAEEQPAKHLAEEEREET